ncbi:hypothetical protein CEXT_540531 [Caerostris extrusa]|uniref:Uncharacterized protein n=1 Tax=Caerostris extrusa TaxID=172846 RepID=A0AAV4NDG0_CAEEX|nr:hypothetical protein CEXT_540531 [Caerostris extrusa]
MCRIFRVVYVSAGVPSPNHRKSTAAFLKMRKQAREKNFHSKSKWSPFFACGWLRINRSLIDTSAGGEITQYKLPELQDVRFTISTRHCPGHLECGYSFLYIPNKNASGMSLDFAL